MIDTVVPMAARRVIVIEAVIVKVAESTDGVDTSTRSIVCGPNAAAGTVTKRLTAPAQSRCR